MTERIGFSINDGDIIPTFAVKDKMIEFIIEKYPNAENLKFTAFRKEKLLNIEESVKTRKDCYYINFMAVLEFDLKGNNG